MFLVSSSNLEETMLENVFILGSTNQGIFLKVTLLLFLFYFVSLVTESIMEINVKYLPCMTEKQQKKNKMVLGKHYRLLLQNGRNRDLRKCDGDAREILFVYATTRLLADYLQESYSLLLIVDH